MKKNWLRLNHNFYKNFLRKIIFLFNSELTHKTFVDVGEILGNSFLKIPIKKLFRFQNPMLSQRIKGINFENPIGLAAGFDYEAKLTQILPAVGFGFETIGTITNLPYEGNPKPRLARLIKSKSLMVYKGFKNDGIKAVSQKLRKMKFEIPVGISIGKTNSLNDKMTQADAIKDIISAFKFVEKSNLKISYYELNISCPSLFGHVTFYKPKNLRELLEAVSKLKIKKPIFVKMPISKTDEETLDLLKLIAEYKMTGVILGNTQTKRDDKNFVKSELDKFPRGGFSGKPTWERSNRLIELTYKNFKNKLVIIGCGGVFSAKDAYTKIKLGACLVQLITGLIFEGPQLAAEINLGLLELLKKDGFKNISDAVGKAY